MQHALQEKVTEYQQLQRELEKLNLSRRKIIAQISENEMVNQVSDVLPSFLPI
jgi:chaperonin cofactor prefoldin